MFTQYEWMYGVAQLAAAFLAFFSALLSLWILGLVHARPTLKAWRFLLVAVVFFSAEEILGSLAVFGVYKTPYLTHIIPSIILGFLIAALVKQTEITKGCES